MDRKSEGKLSVFVDLSEPSGTISMVKEGTVGIFGELRIEKDPEKKLKDVFERLLERMDSDISAIRLMAVSKQSYSATRGRVVKSFLQGLADGLKATLKEVNIFEVLKSYLLSDTEYRIVLCYLGVAQSKHIEDSQPFEVFVNWMPVTEFIESIKKGHFSKADFRSELTSSLAEKTIKKIDVTGNMSESLDLVRLKMDGLVVDLLLQRVKGEIDQVSCFEIK